MLLSMGDAVMRFRLTKNRGHEFLGGINRARQERRPRVVTFELEGSLSYYAGVELLKSFRESARQRRAESTALMESAAKG